MFFCLLLPHNFSQLFANVNIDERNTYTAIFVFTPFFLKYNLDVLLVLKEKNKKSIYRGQHRCVYIFYIVSVICK